jgi:hypothetical protein
MLYGLFELVIRAGSWSSDKGVISAVRQLVTSRNCITSPNVVNDLYFNCKCYIRLSVHSKSNDWVQKPLNTSAIDSVEWRSSEY